MNMHETLVARYFELAVGDDRAAYLAQFAPDAVVEDEGAARHGTDAIRAWRDEVPPVRYDVRDTTTPADGEVRAVAQISGDFPGSPVDLAFAFAFTDDGRIRRLTIRP